MKKEIFSNPWVITIAGTMLGVLAAFLLNDWAENRSAKKYRNQIFDKITEEIHSNHKILKDNYEELKEFNTAYSTISQYDENIMMAPIEMAAFQKKVSWFFNDY